MREIKFRAWDGDKIICLGEARKRDLVSIDEQDFYLRSEYNEVILMQFIGLKDKNGKEIYEGDIVREYCNHENHKGMFDVVEVVYDDIHGKWMTWNHDQFATYDDIIPNEVALETDLLEVIGNIYENPELIKVAEELTKQ